MKQALLTTFLFATGAAAFGQVTLGAGQAPVNNSMFTYYDANEPNPPFVFNKTGTTNIWDFTALTPVPGADDTSYSRLPSQVTGSSNFPLATHALWEVGDNTTTFARIDATGGYILGIYGDVFGTGNNVALHYPGTPKVWSFPLQYGSSKSINATIEYKVSGAEVGQPSIDSAWYKSLQMNDRAIIAEGNMILPAGTKPALLEINREHSIDSLFIKGTATGGQWILAPNFPKEKFDSTYYWYSSESLQQYAHVIYKSGLVTDVNYFKSVTVSPVSTGIDRAKNKAFSIYPNPCKNELLIQNYNPAGHYAAITDLAGAVILHFSLAKSTIDISSLQPGIYFLTLTDESGNNSVAKFIKQ